MFRCALLAAFAGAAAGTAIVLTSALYTDTAASTEFADASVIDVSTGSKTLTLKLSPASGAIKRLVIGSATYVDTAPAWSDIIVSTTLFGSIKGVSYDYGYSVGAPRTVLSGSTITAILYDITFTSSAAGEYRIATKGDELFDSVSVATTGVKFSCAKCGPLGTGSAFLTVHVGFVPTVEMTQPDISAVNILPALAATTYGTPQGVLVNPGFAVQLTVRAPGSTIVDDTAIANIFVTVGNQTGSNIAPIQAVTASEGVTAVTAVPGFALDTAGGAAGSAKEKKVFAFTKLATTEAGTGGQNDFKLLAKAFKRVSDGAYSVPVTITSFAGINLLGLQLEEYVASYTAAATTPIKVLSTAAGGWYNPASSVELSFTGVGLAYAATPTASLWSTASAGLFKGMPAMPGASLAKPNGITATLAQASDGTKYTYTLDLSSADLQPGILRINIPGGTVTATAGKNAPTFVELKVGIPTTLTFQDKNFNSLMDASRSSVTQLVSYPIAKSADATVYAVFNMTFPAEQRASAVAFAETMTVPAFADAKMSVTTALAVKSSTTAFVRVVNTSVLVYYYLDADTMATDEEKISVVPGKFCATLGGKEVCNAINREGTLLVKGAPAASAEGVLTPDCDAYAHADMWGAPLTTFSAALSGAATMQRVMPAAATSDTAALAALKITPPVYVINSTGLVASMFTSSSVTVAGVNIKFDWAVAEMKSVIPGTYVIEAPAGTFATTAATYNAKACFTVSFGWNARFLPGIAASSDLVAAAYLPQRGLNGPFITKGNDIRMRLFGAVDSGATPEVLWDASKVIGILAGVFAASDTKMTTNLAAGLTHASTTTYIVKDSSSKYIDYRMGVEGLPDGEYIIVIDAHNTLDGQAARKTAGVMNTQVRLIIDRAAPKPLSQTYTGKVRDIAAPLLAGSPVPMRIPLPATLFDDATPDQYLKIAFDPVTTDKRGMVLFGTTLGNAALTTDAAVRAPTGNAALTFVATDEAGNTAKGVFTVPVRPQTGSVITVIDQRGVQSRSTLYTGSPAACAGTLAGGDRRLPLTVVVDFDEAVTNVVANSLLCRLNGLPCKLYNGAAIPTPTAATGGRRFTWDLVLDATTVTSLYHGSEIVFGVPGSWITTVVTGLPVRPADKTKVIIDTAAPTGGRASTRVTSGGAFSLAISPDLFYDSTSSADKMRLTLSTPASSFGLTFVSGLMGTAGFSGTVSGVPPNGLPIEFVVTATDEAGNTGTAIVQYQVNAAPATTPVLTLGSSVLNFAEGATALTVFPTSVFTFGALVPTGVTVFLESPSADESTLKEILTHVTSGATSCTAVAYAVDAVTKRGSLGITGCTTVTAAMIQTYLQSITYTNTLKIVGPVTRVLRVVVNYGDPSGILAMATRIVKLTGVNDVPVVVTFGAATWTEADGNAQLVLGHVDTNVTDADDTEFASATVGIVPDADNSVAKFEKCDSDRDFLFLASDYRAPKGAAATGSWIKATCQLVLTPVAPATRLSKVDLLAAIKAVKYVNLDRENPLGFVELGSSAAPYGVRAISLTVTDSANSGKLATAAVNTLVATSAAVENDLLTANKKFGKLTVAGVADAPVFNLGKVYGRGGVFSSPDKFAQMKQITADGKAYQQAKFPLPVLVNATGKVWFKVQFDLRQDKDAAGVDIKGSFAGGSLIDIDSNYVSSASLGPLVKFHMKPAGGSLVEFAGSSVSSPIGAPAAAVGTVFLHTGATGSEVITHAYKNNANAAVTVTVEGSKFIYSTRDLSTLYLLVDATTVRGAVATYLGELEFKISFGSSASSTDVIFYADLLHHGCLDTTTLVADDRKFLVGTVPVDSRITTAVASATMSPFYGLTTSATATAAMFYPNNSLCVYAPTSVSAGGAAAEIGRAGFTTQKAAMAAASASLASAGATSEAKVAALAGLRQAAVGSFQVAIPASSLEGAGSMAITADKAATASLDAIKASIADTSSAQLEVAVKLGPAGTSFSKPVKVCVFGGDTADGTYKVLATASQRDPADESKGYTDFSVLTGQSFDIATGEVCGYTQHFSVFAPIIKVAVSNPTVPKMHLMGGSCPNQCSGHGACRQDGRCACFAGFDGYDCSMRSCPSAESWGEDQQTMHEQSECSGRGVCERGSGVCSCFDGFQGSACERVTCPNDCSGHGKCRLMAELPNVQKAGYSDWEIRRLQVCQCDGGYTGSDCSMRVCPFGDDPESTCWMSAALGVAAVQRQVQRLTVAFADPTGTAAVDTTTDELAMVFRGAGNKNYTTPRIESLWDDSVSATSLANALKALPEFAVTDVTVALSATTTMSKTFDVTFTGTSNTGNEALMMCSVNTQGTYGCPAAGCQPRFNQLRILETLPAGVLSAAQVNINEYAILQDPTPLIASATSATASKWTVETTLTLNTYTHASAEKFMTYSFTGTTVFGESGASVGASQPQTVEETAVPPADAPRQVVGPYGLVMDLVDVDAYVTSKDATGVLDGTTQVTKRTAPITIKWRLPTCVVTQQQSAEAAFEKKECSNRGLCNRDNGECECFSGYAGFNCAQQTVYV